MTTMRMRLVAAVFGSIAVSACTGSQATLAIPPDFELQTSAGISSVSIRESPPGMTDAEFDQLVSGGMASATGGFGEWCRGRSLSDPKDRLARGTCRIPRSDAANCECLRWVRRLRVRGAGGG